MNIFATPHPLYAHSANAATTNFPARKPAGVRATLLWLLASPVVRTSLPIFLLTGLLTAVLIGAVRLLWDGVSPGFAAEWFEAWVITWPIAFVVARLLTPALYRTADALGTSAQSGLAEAVQQSAKRPRHQDFDEIYGAISAADARNEVSLSQELRYFAGRQADLLDY